MPSAPAATTAASPATTSGSRPSTSCSPRWTASTSPPGWWCWPPPTGRTPWTRRCAAPAGSTARSSSRCPTGPSGAPSWPPTPAARTLGPDVDFGQIAAATPGFSGADLANLVNEAALPRSGPAAPPSPPPTSPAPATACCSAPGPHRPLTPDELATVAVHEAGHALVAALSPHADPVSRVTVLGAGQALGLTELLPADDRRLYGESYLADTLAVRLGGRAAERLIRGEASTGAADDLASATALATQMVRDFGLSEAIGPVSYSDRPAVTRARRPRGHSEHTQWLVDQEVAALLTKAETRARDLLTSHQEALNQLTTALLEQETITGDQVRALLHATSPAPVPAAASQATAAPDATAVPGPSEVRDEARDASEAPASRLGQTHTSTIKVSR